MRRTIPIFQSQASWKKYRLASIGAAIILRDKLSVVVLLVSAILTTPSHAAELAEAKLKLPSSGVVEVAFMISDRATLIDLAGPMQVLDQVQSPGTTGFHTFTISETKKPVMVGTIEVIPNYTFEDAPGIDIVIVGAQTAPTESYLEYLRHAAAKGKLVMSVCTGAGVLARAGLLDHREATTHHDFVEVLQKRYPKVHFQEDQSYVHSAPLIYTAGGEMSGLELALHIVELYFDHAVAVKTAQYMDYRSPAWQQ